MKKRVRKKTVLPPKPTTAVVAADQIELGQLRAEFNLIRSQGSYDCGRDVWMAECRKVAHRLFGNKPTPAQWVEAARATTVLCDRCNGSGRYQWGACINGRMSNSAPCFRCDGIGRIGLEKSRRNWGYDQHRRVI